MTIETQSVTVTIIGAGPSGLGCAALLKQMGLDNQDLLIVDAKTIGSSFKAWPKEMKMITPSFPSNGFHQTDLNAITPDTSPAFSLNKEHLSGEDYAKYLNSVASHYDIDVKEHTQIETVEAIDGNAYSLTTKSGNSFISQYVIWAGGEFSAPKKQHFAGSDLCQHNSEVASWQHLEHDHYVVIGCYESGVDAAYNLAKLGKRVTLLDRATEQQDTYDPSRVLSPYTAERLASMSNSDLVELKQGFEVASIIATETGYKITSKSGQTFTCASTPINCTGFNTHLGPVKHLFQLDDDGFPIVNKFDESVLRRNLFYCGPKLVHGTVLLCFIYKFRGRFAVPCELIGTELDLDTSILGHYEQSGMLLDDLSCCEEQQCFC